MKPIELAKKYMEVFYHSGDFRSLKDIFDDKLDFEGPLYTFNRADDYINSLIESPPIGCAFEILEEYETDNRVCLVYRFTKNDKSTLMAQSFSVKEGKIDKIRLIFNVPGIA